MRFYAVLRISSLPIPLVNLTDLCKKFGTCWHTCAKTCAKSTIFQICLYEAKLNGNNLNYIYNFHKFQLFPIVSVLLSSIWVCCSYFPMQKLAKMLPRTSSVVISPVMLPMWCRHVLMSSAMMSDGNELLRLCWASLMACSAACIDS